MSKHARRGDSSQIQFKQRVPTDVIERVRGQLVVLELPAVRDAPEVPVTATIGEFVKFSLRTVDGEVATARRLHVLAHLNKRWDMARSGPARLSHKQLVALAGEVYRLIVARYEENPGSPDDWAAFKAFNRAIKEGRIASAPPIDLDIAPDAAPAAATFGLDLTTGINALPVCDDPRGLEARFGRLVSWVLTLHAIEVDASTRVELLKHVADACQDAGWQLKRNASGDYSTDPRASRFPEFSQAKPITLSSLFDRWREEVKPAASTVTTWRGVVASLRKHLGHDDVRRLAPDDVVSWKDALVASGLSAKTINDTYLTGLRALLNYAVANKLLKENAATGVRVNARRKAGTGMLPYSDAEVARLLSLSATESHPARRWLPLLAATSGARVGELSQLWGSRVNMIDGVTVMELRPAEDGGSFKNEGSERTVPLHPAVLEAGFLDFVKSAGSGPLFYGRSSRRAGSRHASKGAANHLAEWIRKQGFNDPRKAPLHALRHWFKSTASRVGIADSVTDAIQGHADRSSAGTYRHFDVNAFADVIRRIPIQY